MKGNEVVGKAAVIIFAAFAAYAVTLTLVLPYDIQDASDCALSHGYERDSYFWICPGPDGNVVKELDMHVDVSDFRSSMSRDVMRSNSLITPVPILLIDSNDPFVRIVADYLLEETEGYDDLMRITAALWFVQTAIKYSLDSDLYGFEDFLAAPVDTLYLHHGDCEDTSVLLCSILGAMGYDWIILDYDGHIAVGVELDGELLFLETASDLPKLPKYSTIWEGQEALQYRQGDVPDVMVFFNHAFAGTRNIIYTITGI